MGGLVTIGILTAVVGNSLIACSLTLQKYVHNMVTKKPSQSPLFWVALLGMVTGEIGNFAVLSPRLEWAHTAHAHLSP